MGRNTGGKSRDCSFKAKENECILCFNGEENESLFGKLHRSEGISAHYFCILFACGLAQNGRSTKQGIQGFLVSDIIQEAKRGRLLRCIYCKKIGATVGCYLRKCKAVFHYPCGLQNGAMNQFFGKFCSYCRKHKPTQSISVPDTPVDCSICCGSPSVPSTETHLKSPCCSSGWFHRVCMQNYAFSAGYFFKCPLCNDKKLFRNEMQEYGIFILDKDASWEEGNNAYQDLLERPHCGAEDCKCPNGRDSNSNKSRNKWSLVYCVSCGSAARHRGCESMPPKLKWVCPNCKNIEEELKKQKELKALAELSQRFNLKPFSIILKDLKHEISETENHSSCMISAMKDIRDMQGRSLVKRKMPAMPEVRQCGKSLQSDLLDATCVAYPFPVKRPQQSSKMHDLSELIGGETSIGLLSALHPKGTKQPVSTNILAEPKHGYTTSVVNQKEPDESSEKACCGPSDIDSAPTVESVKLEQNFTLLCSESPTSSEEKENQLLIDVKLGISEEMEDNCVDTDSRGENPSGASADTLKRGKATRVLRARKCRLAKSFHQPQITMYLKNWRENQRTYGCSHLDGRKYVLKKYKKCMSKMNLNHVKSDDLLKQGLRTLDNMISRVS